MVCLQMLHNSDAWIPYLDNIFSKVDKNGDGIISLSELVEFIPPTDENSSEAGLPLSHNCAGSIILNHCFEVHWEHITLEFSPNASFQNHN